MKASLRFSPCLGLFLLLHWGGAAQAQSPFPAGAQPKKLAEGFKFTEGPIAGPDGRIYFSDIPNNRIHVHDPKSGETKVHREETGGANGLVWTSEGALLACEGRARRVSLQKGDQVTTLVDAADGKKLNAPNDLVLDGEGGLYFSDPAYGLKPEDQEQPHEAVYYATLAEGKARAVVTDFVRPNGLVFSPDKKTLYIADAGGGKTYAFDVTGAGQLANRREFAPIGSDGMTIDSLGRVYLTWKGDVWVFGSDGKELARLACPEGPANCKLVGRTLYITARTGFYAIEIDAESVK